MNVVIKDIIYLKKAKDQNHNFATGIKLQTARPMIAPFSGHIKDIRLKWAYAVTGNIKLKLFKANNTTVGTSLQLGAADLVELHSATLNGSSATSWNYSASWSFDKHDILILAVEIPDDPGGMGSILGSCVFRFNHEIVG